jgi:hypothetical protein
MLKNDKSLCPRTDEIVAYIYDEIGGGAGAFETHLSDCVICTDEFAAVSNARFEVYEWRKAEFVPLPTPEFTLPVTSAGIEGSGVGFLAGLRAFLGAAGLPAAAAALVLVAVGVGFVMLRSEGGPVNDLAANSREIAPPPATVAGPAIVERRLVDESVSEPISTAPGAVRVSQPATVSPRRSPKKGSGVRYANVPAARRAPVLNPVEDETDRTLRLTDLFDGVGGQ